MGDSLAVEPVFEAIGEVCRASSSCCGAKLNLGGEPGATQFWLCRDCGEACDRVMSAPEEVTARG